MQQDNRPEKCRGNSLAESVRDDDLAQRLQESEERCRALMAERQQLMEQLHENERRFLYKQAEFREREQALREANRRMEEFLGIASHELRTPLTTIKANVQLAKRRLKALMPPGQTDSSTEKAGLAAEMLVRAERQINVLNRLVGDMIDISRIKTGKLQVHLRQEPYNLCSIVQEVTQEQRKANAARIIHMTLPASEKVAVVADPDRIGQVLTNYLTNALKYSPADKPVGVDLLVEDHNARVVVRDEGQGLSLQEQQQVWQCFYQARDVTVLSGSGVGLGLGLHISQTIVELHQGQVGVESVVGQGSTFWFTLPLAQQEERIPGE
jgi:signal transduction histidine kinase